VTSEHDVPTAPRTIRGDVAMPAGAPGERAARIVVQVEDVSRMDAPSIVVGEQQIEDVPLDGGSVPFEVEVPAGLVDERGSYSVRVHVDVTGTGQVEHGDLITTQSYPVLTGGNPDARTVEVKRI
jgi:putative lipoprotein